MKLLSHQRLRECSKLRPWRNIGWIALDYACALLVAGCTAGVHFWRQERGLQWAWEVPVVLVATFLMGIFQHRIGLMGHEASHYLLLPDRAWNDRLANLLVFHPLFSEIWLYRKKHTGHHLHPNDPEQDPNLFGDKVERIYAKFPMGKGRFVRCFYLMFFWPPFVLGILQDLFLSLTTGTRKARAAAAPGRGRMALPGLVWFILASLVLVGGVLSGAQCWPLIAGMSVVALVVWACAPERWFGGGDGRTARDVKWFALQRLVFNALLLLGLAVLTHRFGGQVLAGFIVLWIFPLIYVFPFMMHLREIYQHANAGTGELDNTRIMHVDPITRWALMGYGNDFHLIHHLYPNIPHDRLEELHEDLLRESAEYAAAVQETHGVMRAPAGRRSILDALAR